MKKSLLVLLSFSASFCFGQLTITQSDMPNAGDTLRVSNSLGALDPSYTDSTCSIDGFLWDYSYLTANSQWVRKFDSPSTFTFPFNVLFNPVNTSYGEAQYTPDSIPFIGIKPDDSYNFYRETSSKYRQVGAGLTINSLPIPFAYNPHDTIYRFPLNCGNRDTSHAEFGLALPGIGYYGQKIDRVNFADGRGTLITLFGTFPAVRHRSMISIRDTFADTTGAGGFAFSRPMQYEYTWLVKTGKIPYLTVTATDIAGTPVVNNIEYRDSIRGVTQIGVGELNSLSAQLSVFPNPAFDIVMLDYELSSSADIRIGLYDISGRKLKSVASGKQTFGKHLEVVNVKEFSAGIYFVQLSSGRQSVSKKLVLLR